MNLDARMKALQEIDKRVKGETVKRDDTFGAAGIGLVDIKGKSLEDDQFNYKAFSIALEEAITLRKSYITVVNMNGEVRKIRISDAEKVKGTVLKNNEDDYFKKTRSGLLEDRVLSALIMAAEAKGGSAYNGDTVDLNYHGEIRTRADYKITMDEIAIHDTEAQRIKDFSINSSFFSKLKSTLKLRFGSKNSIAKLEERRSALQAVDNRVKCETVKRDTTFGSPSVGFTDENGISLDDDKFNYHSFGIATDVAKATGSSSVTVINMNGIVRKIDLVSAEMMKGSILRNNEDDYLQKVRSGVLEDRVLSALIMAAEAKGGSAYNGDTTDLNYHGEIKRRADYKKTIDQLTIEIATKGLKNVKKPKDEMSQMMTESRVNENSHQEKGSGMQKKRSSDNRYGFVDYAMFTVFSLLGILVISLLVMMILTFK